MQLYANQALKGCLQRSAEQILEELNCSDTDTTVLLGIFTAHEHMITQVPTTCALHLAIQTTHRPLFGILKAANVLDSTRS
jgi:hypothetical protein